MLINVLSNILDSTFLFVTIKNEIGIHLCGRLRKNQYICILCNKEIKLKKNPPHTPISKLKREAQKTK